MRVKPKRIVKMTILGEITPETLRQFVHGTAPDGEDGFLKNDKPGVRIEITLSSPGGDIDVGMAIYELIRTAAAKVAIVGYGIVGSIAVLIFMAAKERILSAGTRLFLHPGTIMSDIPENIFTMRAKSQELMILHKWYTDQISSRAFTDPAAIADLCDKDTFMDAQEAKRLGIATWILLYTDR